MADFLRWKAFQVRGVLRLEVRLRLGFQFVVNNSTLYLSFISTMLPKRFRQRIQKAEKYVPSRTQEAFTSNGDSQPTSRSATNIMTQLQKAIVQIASRLEEAPKSSEVLGRYSEQMESRDHFVLIETPRLQDQRSARDRQIKLWLGEVCHRVFSVAFNYFSHKIFDTQTMKVFCSECWLGNVISLSKTNQLTKQDFELINMHLKKQILPYYLLRYPQSSNKQVNQKLNRSVAATDYLDTNQNNMFLKSKIIFEYRQTGVYYDLIMRFINYLQELPEKQIPMENNQTMFDDFNERMERLFTAVYSRKWTETNLYDAYYSENQTVDQLRTYVNKLQQQIANNMVQRLMKIEGTSEQDTNIAANKAYQDAVKQYTKYAINRKISQNVPVYSFEQISHSNIKILDPTILRIIVKWCGQLEEKFESDYFLERNQPFVMLNGDQVQMNDQFREKLCQYASEQWKEIKQFLTNIESNIYEKQSELSFKNLMYYSSQKLPQYEQSIIKFANRNTEDVNHYAVCYLNRLIHGLMKISKKVYDFHLKGWAQWPYPPTFLSFKISDLMRCRCFSKEKEIIRIYKQLEIQSQINPQILRVIKVKNRLNKGTKDILLNVLFHQQVLCQIQLAIKVDLSQFSLWSDKFNHYIYELQRSTYGPVAQLCSIWSSNDERSVLLKNQKIRIDQFDHTCNGKSNLVEIFPFTCSICYRHYSQSRYIYHHYKCGTCPKFWTCALCRINTLSEEELTKELRKTAINLKLGKRIGDFNDLPEYFVGFKLQSQEAVGLKFRKFVIDHQKMIVRIENGKLKVVVLKKKDTKAKEKFLDNFIFFELKQADAQLQRVQPQQVLDETTLAQISQCYKKRGEALRITRKNITTALLTKLKDRRAQSNINSLSFPENCIDEIEPICYSFPNVTILNLCKNKIKSLKGLRQMSSLKDLYLGENQFKEITQLDTLTKLKYVQLGDNPNAPQFKCSLQKLTHLQSLTMIRSNFTTFPEQVCQVSSLKLLWLFQNRIKTIPASIGKLKNLQYLHMQMNQLSQLPAEIYQLHHLVKLMLSFNQIKHISSKIQNLKKLQILALEDNPLENIPYDHIIGLPVLQICTFNKKYEEEFLRDKVTHKIIFR